MCGLIGVQGSFPRELLSQMRQVITHRGPDDFGEQYFVSQGGIDQCSGIV